MLGETRPPAQDSPKPAAPAETPFVIFFIFPVKPGYRDRLLDRFETHVTETRKEPGNLLFELYTLGGADDTLVVYEHWRRETDVWDVHMKQPYSVETGALMNEAVGEDLLPYMNFATEVH